MEENKQFVEFAVEVRKYNTLLTENYKQRKSWTPPNEKHLLSYIPGTVVDIYVKEGDRVKKGELLLIHEAMKMQNRIEMPFDGTIAKIHINKGEKIPKNHLMIEIA